MPWTVYNSDGKVLQSAELGDSSVTSAKIATGAIVAADINASAAIEFSQMENLTTARALVTDGNGDIIVSGVTTTELELLDGLTSSTAELNILDGVTSNATELNLLDNVSGLVQADLTKLAAIDSSAAELNLLDGVSGLVQADFTKLAAVTVTAAEVNHLSNIASNVKVQIDAKAAVGSGTPSTQTLPDTAATGTSTEAARLDHVHTMPSAAGVPSGVIAFMAGSCPSGWSEYTAARGRYVVGVPSGGTVAGTQGTALTNQENRAVGQHTHTFSGSALGNHNHTQDSHIHYAPQGWSNSGLFNYVARGGNGNRVDIQSAAGTTATNQSAAAGTPAGTNANSGSVASTNAPYIQLTVCQKD